MCNRAKETTSSHGWLTVYNWIWQSSAFLEGEIKNTSVNVAPWKWIDYDRKPWWIIHWTLSWEIMPKVPSVLVRGPGQWEKENANTRPTLYFFSRSSFSKKHRHIWLFMCYENWLHNLCWIFTDEKRLNVKNVCISISKARSARVWLH